MVTQPQKKASYHCGIGKLLRAAYRREFTMRELGKCKCKFETFDGWYETLKSDQRQRVDAVLEKEYGG